MGRYNHLMPIHDWTRVNAGTFHDFHTAWIVELRGVLNSGMLPDGYYALAEQVAGATVPDVLTLQDMSDGASDAPSAPGAPDWKGSGGIAVATAPPRTVVSDTLSEAVFLAAKRKRLAIRHTT